MKLHNKVEIDAFKKAIDECTGDVYLTSNYGDKFNLKSLLSQYVAISALIGDKGDELELWCDNKLDEQRMFRFFNENPNVI